MSEKNFQKKLAKIRKRGERYKQEYELKAEYAKYVPDKKKNKVSNIMLVIVVVAIVGYAIANFVLQYNMGIEISSTLTTCWYAFWGSEIISLAAIKCSKTKHYTENSSDVCDYYEPVVEEEYINETYE